MLILGLQPPLQAGGGAVNQKPTVNVTLYASEISGAKFGWGLSRDNVTSPGPTLKFKVGDVVGITIINAGQVPHAFVIVASLNNNAPTLFNSEVASSNSPIPSGGSKQSIFKITDAGEFQYICPIPGHKELGMHGNVTVTK